jgi:hypothetical protein
MLCSPAEDHIVIVCARRFRLFLRYPVVSRNKDWLGCIMPDRCLFKSDVLNISSASFEMLA